ncbi:thiopurine S-methyltransferase [Microbulbifer marinus]|uniref:Thiopurine S-methyltransferase n=1 Tax=Microbulbifer marinus TaxID=658218 RepID=A0A1H3WWE8_9GAMM|nr:thiopurine S-methyltransferase [Microbulbifer marinus]SDZ91486.1 thiopurine S-methyltransferase [Microbulbifer marinus]
MEANFWHRKWADNEIGFHASEANPLLVKYFSELSLAENSRVFVPLCGKTLDIGWLLANGYRAVGAELSRLAIEQLFEELGVEPAIAQIGNTLHFSAEAIDIFVGDIFDLSADTLGKVDAIYDRAALVALPEEMRKRYSEHLLEITHGAPQLLITFEYDQSLQPGPPFSISNAEVERHYGDHYQLTLAESQDVPGGLKGKCAAMENAWLLRRS